jgi:hypothetical protein
LQKLLGLIGWFRSPNLINKWTRFNQLFWLTFNLLLNHGKHVGVGSPKGLWVRGMSNTPYKLCGATYVAGTCGFALHVLLTRTWKWLSCKYFAHLQIWTS